MNSNSLVESELPILAAAIGGREIERETRGRGREGGGETPCGGFMNFGGCRQQKPVGSGQRDTPVVEG